MSQGIVEAALCPCSPPSLATDSLLKDFRQGNFNHCIVHNHLSEMATLFQFGLVQPPHYDTID